MIDEAIAYCRTDSLDRRWVVDGEAQPNQYSTSRVRPCLQPVALHAMTFGVDQGHHGWQGVLQPVRPTPAPYQVPYVGVCFPLVRRD